MRFQLVVCLSLLFVWGCSESKSGKPKSSPPTSADKGDRRPGDKAPSNASNGGVDRAKVQRLIARARDTETAGREQAILELGEIAGEEPELAFEVFLLFQELLKDSDRSIRIAVVMAAGEAGDARDFRARNLLAKGNPILEHLEFLTALVRALEDPERGVREAVPRTLAKIVEYNFPAFEFLAPKVNPLLRSEQPGTRAAAAEVVRHMASRLDRAWEELINSPSDSEKATAVKMTEIFQSMIPNLESLKTEEDPEARKEAERALSEIAKFSQSKAAPAGQD